MKSFTKTIAVLFILGLILQACVMGNIRAVQGNGKLVNHEFKISDYKEINVYGCGDLIYEYKPEKEPYLQIYTDENLVEYIICESGNGKLTIKTKDNINPSKFKIYTNSSEINKISVAGSSDIHLKGEVNAKNLNLSISGSGNIVSDSLYCDTFFVGISGSGSAKLKGVANKAEFKISGSGDVHAYDYKVRDVICSISGSGDMEVYVSDNLDVKVSGSGDVKYKGSPRVNQKVSGSGGVKKVD